MITRIVTCAKPEHKDSGKDILCFNTHFDHRGVEARQKSIILMSEKITEIAGNGPVIVMGDFNIRKYHPVLGNGLYNNLMGIFRDNNSLVNSEYTSITPVTSGGATFNGFTFEREDELHGAAIDYIFVNDHFTVELYRVDRIIEGDLFISDHWPVVSIISFSRKE